MSKVNGWAVLNVERARGHADALRGYQARRTPTREELLR